ncbi:TetR/AcrR family transcriptional regulator [Conexibacter sp. SYSU D00693]|uniref:TetR/AcrR family transcriptional regulator n=1 Tax=Conexibacter sp. SYSU D00693 TaxID=2812560 RepID=UPI00196B7B7B|nr:TetR/AcrR family transcriptional regulator [Conexibacter sp. SYSU D00693]
MSPSPAPPGRRTQEERRTASARRLAQAAVELFAERGYDATSMGAIAQRAGYSRTLVNARYGSKEALLEALLQRELEDRLVAPAAEGADGLGRALLPIDRVVALLDEDEQLLRALLTVMFEAIGPAPALRPHVVGWLTRLREATTVALAAGVRDGSVRADADRAAAVEELATASIGMVFRWLLEADYPLADELRAWRERLHARLAPTC